MARDDHGIEATGDWGALLVGTVEKTADEVVNNSAALQDDDELLFAMAANATYTFEFVLWVHNDGGPAAGVQVALNGPAAPGYVFYWVGITTAFAVGPFTGNGGRAAAYETAFSEAIAGGEWICIRISGSVENGANAGNLVLRWAQNAAVEVDVRVKQGSYVVWHRV